MRKSSRAISCYFSHRSLASGHTRPPNEEAEDIRPLRCSMVRSWCNPLHLPRCSEACVGLKSLPVGYPSCASSREETPGNRELGATGASGRGRAAPRDGPAGSQGSSVSVRASSGDGSAGSPGASLASWPVKPCGGHGSRPGGVAGPRGEIQDARVHRGCSSEDPHSSDRR